MTDVKTVCDLITGDKDNSLSSLFTKSARKPAPVYDYSVVPDRVTEDLGEASGDGEKKVNVKKKKKDKETVSEDKVIGESDNSGDNKIKPEVVKKKQNVDEKSQVLNQDRMAQVKHEDSKERLSDPEIDARTVFVGNLPISFKKKQLKALFAQYGKVETVRFRGAARPDMKTTKKIAVITKKFHEDRTNINAYVRYSTVEEAVESCKLNCSEVNGHTIRVDMAVASDHDIKKAVFLGNLSFKTQEDEIMSMFAKCGDVASVRLVRDSATGIGRGIGYVNFVSEDSVGFALRLNSKELCGRKIRVTRAVNKKKSKKPVVGQVVIKKKVFDNKKDRAGKSRKDFKEKSKSFQGVTSGEKKQTKPKNKKELKNRIMAKKLAC